MSWRSRTRRTIDSVCATAATSSSGPGTPLGPDELQQSVAHPTEVAQVPVVGERDMGPAVEKRVHVLLRDDVFGAVQRAPNVGQQAARGDLPRQILQIPIEYRERRDPIDERRLGHPGIRVPRHHPKAGEVQK
jgi:hypothetical protein